MSACTSSDSSVTVDENDYYLKLSKLKWTFEGASKSKLTNVFYDDCNVQVFSVRSGDVTEVNVVSPIPDFCKNFQMVEKGHITSMKFSPDLRILSIQRTKHAVEFLSFEDNQPGTEFSYPYKGNTGVNASLLGYMWIGESEIALVSDQGIKICKVSIATKCVTQLKSQNVCINWFSYFHPLKLLLISYGTNSSGVSLQLLQFKASSINKLTKFELGEDIMSRSARPGPTEHVILGIIYSKPRILVMSYQNSSNGLMGVIVIYTIVKLSSVKKTHELRIKEPGRFAISLVDNLVVVHNQASKKSFVYDIKDDDSRGSVIYHLPVAKPQSIAPDESSYLYSPNWIIFQPNIVLDAKLGSLSFLELNLVSFIRCIEDPICLISFLLMRSNSKEVLANSLELIVSREKNLDTLSKIFDKINEVYRKHLEENLKGQVSITPNTFTIEDDPNLSFKTILDQAFIYTFVFSKLADKLNSESSREDIKSYHWTLIEYIRSLNAYQIPVMDYLYKLLIQRLVINKEFFQLHQLLQYHAIADSKGLACILLSLESVYPAALQLAIDMLERIGSAREEIIEILLSKNQIFSALRYSRLHPGEGIPPEKYIEVAKNTGDQELYQSVLTHFNISVKID